MSTLRRLNRGCSARENHEMPKLKQDLHYRRVTGRSIANGYHDTTTAEYSDDPDNKIGSRTRLWLGCSYVAFLVCSVVLVKYPPSGMECRTRSVEDAEALDHIYMAVTVACFTLAVDNMLNLMFLRKHAKVQIGLIVLYLDCMTATFSLLAWTGKSPVWIGRSGSEFHPIRHLTWLMSTPAQLYMLSLQSAMSSTSVATVISVDLVMILSVVASEFMQRVFRLPLYFLCCMMFLWLTFLCWEMFSASIEGAHDTHTQRMLKVLRMLTIVFWSMFPGVHGAVEYMRLSFTTQELLWSVCDCGGKILFSSSLLHSNFMTIEQRKLSAIKQLEDADRTRMVKSLRSLVENKHSFITSVQTELRGRAGDLMKLSDNIDSYLDQAAYDDYYLDQLKRDEIEEIEE